MSQSGCGIDQESLSGMQGVDVSKLEVGTKLKVETYNSTYAIMILSFGKITISGGTTRTGHERYPYPMEGSIIGSAYYGRSLKLNTIEKGRCLLLDMGGEKRELQTKMAKQYEERFQIPLFLAFILLGVELFISDRRRRL